MWPSRINIINPFPNYVPGCLHKFEEAIREHAEALFNARGWHPIEEPVHWFHIGDRSYQATTGPGIIIDSANPQEPSVLPDSRELYGTFVLSIQPILDPSKLSEVFTLLGIPPEGNFLVSLTRRNPQNQQMSILLNQDFIAFDGKREWLNNPDSVGPAGHSSQIWEPIQEIWEQQMGPVKHLAQKVEMEFA